MPEPDNLLTADELANRLGIKPGTILDWHRRGRIPSRKLSHKVVRFDLSEVLAALEPRPADDGKAVVVISSYLPEIMALSDRILVSRQGKVVEEFSALDATEEKIMYAAVH